MIYILGVSYNLRSIIIFNLVKFILKLGKCFYFSFPVTEGDEIVSAGK